MFVTTLDSPFNFFSKCSVYVLCWKLFYGISTYSYLCAYLFFLPPPSLSFPLLPFFPPNSLLSSLIHFLSVFLRRSPRSCLRKLSQDHPGFAPQVINSCTFGFCLCGQEAREVRSWATGKDLGQGTASLAPQEVGESLHGSTAATDTRDRWGQEILKSCAREADIDGFEEMNRR